MAIETIEVRYQPVVSAFGLTFYHTLVVYTDNSGNQWVARGGPSQDNKLETSVSPFGPGHVDWAEDGVTDKSSPVASGDDLSGVWKKITDGFQKINNNGEYDNNENNCNTATGAGLKEAGLDFPSHPEIMDIEVPGEDGSWWDNFKEWAENNYNKLEKSLDDFEKDILDFLLGLSKGLGKVGEEISDLFGKARTASSPLVFDLDGDGIEISLLGGQSPILFDHDANGIKTGTAWLKSDDALLVLDRNGNGQIDSGRELFGNNTLLSNGNKAADGYAALGELDSNGDGVIDAQDAQFSALRLWRDLDQDGVSDAGELFGLEALGVTQISLAKTNSSKTLSDGTRLDGSASFVVNGEERSYTDAWFAENPFYREFTDSIPLTEAAKQLPGMKGAGAVRDLREAASLDASLAAQLAGMQSGGWVSRADMQGQMDTLVSQWARTADFETSREKAQALFGVELLLKPQGATDVEIAVSSNCVIRQEANHSFH